MIDEIKFAWCSKLPELLKQASEFMNVKDPGGLIVLELEIVVILLVK